MGADSQQKGSEEAAATKIWSVYISEAEKYDKALVESWRSDMEGMLIFAGLFSAILTAFIIESYKTLSPDSGDDTVALLAQISSQLAGIANSTPFTVPDTPPFVTPMSSIICNALWFVSLGLSLSCALIATLVEQWAREFQHKSELRSAPIVRARIYTYLYYGLKRFNMHAVVEILPLLLHASLICFYVGLVAFLIPVNHSIMILSGFILALMVIVYVVLTILPLVYLDCPYQTPLSTALWQISRRLRTVSRAISPTEDAAVSASDASMVNMLTKRATHDCAQRDYRALRWMMQSLADDDELEPFVEGIPDVLWGAKGRRNAYDEHFKVLLRDPDVRLLHRLEDFLRGCDNELISPETRNRRRISALKALWAIETIPRQDGLFPEPLEAFDTSLLDGALVPPKIAHYQSSTRTVINLNLLLSARGEIHDMTNALLECKGRALNGDHPHVKYLRSKLPSIADKLNRIPPDLWQSAADREHRASIADLLDNPPSDVQSTSWWISQCLEACESLPRSLLELEYETFVSYMIESAELDSPPYEFHATRKVFSFDESAVPPDMAGSFSTAFDSIVSRQCQRPAYSTHGDEILSTLLSVCASSMADDSMYFPLNLTNYILTKDGELADSQVIRQTNTLWLFSCLTSELISKSASPLIATPVIHALWKAAHLMARQFLDTWAYKSTASVHQRGLDALRNAPPALTPATATTIALVQNNAINAFVRIPQDRGYETVHRAEVYPLFPVGSVSPELLAAEGDGDEDPDAIPRFEILALRVMLLAEFLEYCATADLSRDYGLLETAAVLTAFTPYRPGVSGVLQVCFARGWSAVFQRADAGRKPVQELLETVAAGKMMEVYSGIPLANDEHPWLDDPVAVHIMRESFVGFLRREDVDFGDGTLRTRLMTMGTLL